MTTEDQQLDLWIWEYTDRATGQRRRTTWLMTEHAARTRWGHDARRVEGSRISARMLAFR